jgi:hypothetical protein
MPKAVTEKRKISKKLLVFRIFLLTILFIILAFALLILKTGGKTQNVKDMELLTQSLSDKLGGGFDIDIGGKCTVYTGGCPRFRMTKTGKYNIDEIISKLGKPESEGCYEQKCTAEYVQRAITYVVHINKDVVVIEGKTDENY